MKKLASIIALALALGPGCVHRARVVITHPNETEHNHFIVIDQDDNVFDCYSRPSDKWNPMCRPVIYLDKMNVTYP